ncbi:GNAT family N-acetyltransferase [Neobacillus notoginsengisoli]|uniref:GNAT family N-acetyltransferase n=1 Tax=Neobacillus notoginsengisoli TaxID=1578198 RepID=A0A417YS53_9BACI|nr:GNAT family N-acetyltransferase [Neobacillus notoginsengisoli]RHW38128.1 GNAT family N-acetyltransferase [Neobacillus notoginsengisoli]
MKIKIARLEDYEALMPIHKEVHDYHLDARPDIYKLADTTFDWNYFKSLVENKDARIFYIKNEDEIIAFAICRKQSAPDRKTVVPRDYVYVEDFGVKKEFRRQGLAKLLFEKVVKFAKETGASGIELGVWEFNEPAIRFYESMGMQTQVRRMELKL